MDELLSNPMAPAIAVVAGILLVVLAGKLLKGFLKVLLILVLVALIIAAALWLSAVIQG